MRKLLLLPISLLFVAGSCARESRDDPKGGGERMRTDRSTVPPRLGEHWVQGEQLRRVMAEISQYASRWPAGVPDDPESAPAAAARGDADDAFRDVIGLADGLADAAAQIPRSVADRPMSAEDRRGFRAEADRLRGQALELRRAARARRVEPMQRTFGQIAVTCASCHSQYKEYTGELEGAPTRLSQRAGRPGPGRAKAVGTTAALPAARIPAGAPSGSARWVGSFSGRRS